MCLGGGGGLHCYNHFPEPKFLCVWGGGGLHFCTFIRLLLGCALMWVRNTTCQIRLQTSDFIPIAAEHNWFDGMGWVAVSQDDENKTGRARKIPMLMKPKITLKVAHAVDNEGASFFEASLGCLDWEWDPQEDATSAKSRSTTDQDSSSGNESSESSDDANSSLSYSSSFSSTSSSGVEVLPCEHQGHKVAHY